MTWPHREHSAIPNPISGVSSVPVDLSSFSDYLRQQAPQLLPVGGAGDAGIAAASWDSVIFDLGGDSLVRIPTLEPLRGSKAHVGALLESARTAAELVDQLTTT